MRWSSFGLFSASLLLVTAAASGTPATTGSGATWELGPALNVARQAHHTAALPGGRVAVFGGHGNGFTALSSAEVLEEDPQLHTWSWRQLQMNATHDLGAFAVLADGRILIAGGADDWGIAPGHEAAEIYDPSDDSFTRTGNMNYPRSGTAACTLTDGRVLVASAWYAGGAGSRYAEVFDPATGTWSLAGALTADRSYALLLPTSDGGAVLFGGQGAYGTPHMQTVEYWDPSTATWSQIADTPFAGESGWFAFGNHYLRAAGAQRLANGRYLVTFLTNTSPTEYADALFDPATRTFSRLTLTPALSDGESTNYQMPVVAPGGTTAHHVVQHTTDAYLQLQTLSPGAGTLSVPDGWWGSTPTYVWGSCSAIACDTTGRLVITGGRAVPDNGNFAANTNTYFAIPEAVVPDDPPAAPTLLQAEISGIDSVLLSWQDNSANEDGFRIERMFEDGSFEVIDEVGPGETTYDDWGLDPGTQETWRVCAFNDAGDSDFTAAVELTTAGGKLSAAKKATFGKVKLGRTRGRKVLIRNKDKRAPLWVGLELDDGPFTTDGGIEWVVIQPRKSYKLLVTYAPEEAGKHTGTLYLWTSDEDREDYEIALTGKAK